MHNSPRQPQLRPLIRETLFYAIELRVHHQIRCCYYLNSLKITY
ncbi:Uncharacterised protein [Vibrio cholerae]|nr:Uncharacterised protein [Vibrio cholerae]